MAIRKLILLALIGMPASAALAHTTPGVHTKPAYARPLTGDQRIVHALNRLAFGPRPGDLDAIRKVGLDRWIDEQLHPERIDDAAVDAKLARLPSLTMTAADLMSAFMGDLATQRAARLARASAATGSPSAAVPGQPAMMRAQQATHRSVEALGSLDEERLARDVESHRQTQEVLVDFWSNHFNVDARKGPVRTLVLAHVRDAIRPHVLGKFRDLLGAVAKSPAMLFYLDNASSTRSYEPDREGRRRGGVNENYARELMELHTLGVDGGYTQHDVQEVARCLTGWGIDRQTGRFRFYPARHDDAAKVVLGHAIPAGGGIQDGETVLDILASSPAAARFLASKLCVRLVSDDPPAALVGRAAQVFRRTGGDLRAVVASIVTSPEFCGPEAFRSKVKPPLVLAVSAVRALDGTIEIPDTSLPLGRIRLAAVGGTSLARGVPAGYGARARVGLAGSVATMGEPLFAEESPTGYPEDSMEWMSAGSLVGRMNFATSLAAGKLSDVRIPASDLSLDRIANGILGAGLSPATAGVLRRALGLSDAWSQAAALMVGSPEFQRY